MFNVYSGDKKQLIIKAEMPFFCEKYHRDAGKKCMTFYEQLITEGKENGFYQCPYGFSCYKENDKIHTCLIINEHSDLKKVNIHLKEYKQKLKDFTNYSLAQIRNVMNSIAEIERKHQILRLTIHDLKNATKHFMDLAENVKEDEELRKRIAENEELFSAIEGYSLIQYRLDYHDQLLEDDLSTKIESSYSNFHKMLKKLSKLMKYRGIKKDVEIEFHGYTSNIFKCNRDMYLAYFIFLENAIKYAQQYSVISIEFIDEDKDNTKIIMKNVCATIKDYEMQNIFKDGYRSSFAQLSSKGSGLGLGLAKKICEKSEVELNVQYEPIDDKCGLFVLSTHISRNSIPDYQKAKKYMDISERIMR